RARNMVAKRRKCKVNMGKARVQFSVSGIPWDVSPPVTEYWILNTYAAPPSGRITQPCGDEAGRWGCWKQTRSCLKCSYFAGAAAFLAAARRSAFLRRAAVFLALPLPL